MSAGADAVVAARGLVKIYAATLLRLPRGLERPDAGEILLGGRRVDGLSETVWAVLRWPTSNPLETRHNVGHK